MVYPELWAAVAFLFGSVIGSFLNVVIWRVPRGESVVSPGSHCPHCDRELTALENIPLLSFLVLRAKCRTCGGKISWRYFCVELLTATVFAVLTYHFGNAADSVAYCLFAAALIAAFFIDLEHFIIPDGVNTFALLVGFGRDFWGIAAGEPGHALLWGWLPRSIFGAIACAGVFVAIQVVGLAIFRKNAMGDGDVKLARAIGAVLMPLRYAMVSFLFAIGVGAIAGIAMVLVTQALSSKEVPDSESGPETTDGAEAGRDEPEPPASMKETLIFGAIYLTFFDLLVELGAKLGIPAARRLAGVGEQEENQADDQFVPGPTHIPFGPFMVVGFFLAIWLAEPLIRWYLRFSGLG